MTTLYVYNLDDNALVARINGRDNAACEAAAESYDPDIYGRTYSPAFGAVDGLIDSIDAAEIDADPETQH